MKSTAEYIVIERFGDQPHIRGRRIRVVDIIELQRDNNWSVAQLAQELTLNEAEIRAALAFYEANQELIDDQIARDIASVP